MKISKCIIIKREKYYLYDTYSNINDVKDMIKYQKKKNKKNKYFILEFEKGYLFPYIMYGLYMNKVIKIW